MIVGSASDLIKPGLANVYGVEPNLERSALYCAKFTLNSLKTNNIGYAYEDDDIGQNGKKSLAKYVTANGGKLSASIGFPATTTDYSTQAARQPQATGRPVGHRLGGLPLGWVAARPRRRASRGRPTPARAGLEP